MQDEIFFVIAVTAAIVLPGVALLPWMFITRSVAVRAYLLKSLAVLGLTPLMQGAVFAGLKTICDDGHLDAPFRNCGPVPDAISGISYVLILVPALAAVAMFGLRAGTIEFSHWKRRRNA